MEHTTSHLILKPIKEPSDFIEAFIHIYKMIPNPNPTQNQQSKDSQKAFFFFSGQWRNVETSEGNVLLLILYKHPAPSGRNLHNARQAGGEDWESCAGSAFITRKHANFLLFDQGYGWRCQSKQSGRGRVRLRILDLEKDNKWR